MEILARLIRILLQYAAFLTLVLSLAPHNCVGRPSYEVFVERIACTPEEATLIGLAESVCPPYEDVVAVFNGDPPPESEECLWWYDEYRTRIPYAITGDAIDYYENEVLTLEQEQTR